MLKLEEFNQCLVCFFLANNEALFIGFGEINKGSLMNIYLWQMHPTEA